MGRKKEIDFYLTIPIMTEFAQVFDGRGYATPPEDWNVVVTDVVNSTTAIEAGNYKDVNVAGALPAMAITNYIGNMQFPFVFGGDGMTYVIPQKFVERVKDILADTRALVRTIFNLELRVGIVPISTILKEGKTLRVGRLQVSDRYVQAILDGDGVDYAETLLKNPDTTDQYAVPRNHHIQVRADFTGFVCRWKPVKSPKGETISLIVKPQNPSDDTHAELMREVFLNIGTIFGTPDAYRPVTSTNQRLALSRTYLHTEASVFARNTRGVAYWIRLYMVRVNALMMRILRFRLRSIERNNSLNSDFRKFDGTLKMVISCTTAERRRMVDFLETLYRSGRVFYGIHVSDSALLTCLVQQGQDEVHFVDSDNGGYALAAKHLKSQIAERVTVRG